LTQAGFTLQWVAAGGGPLLFHLVNVGLYTAVVLLVFALARRLMPPPGATAAALLFAAHPLHTEAVANVVGQSELLVAAPLLLAAVLYLDGRRAGFSLIRIWAIVLLYFLACLAKEHAVLFPLLLLTLEAALGPAGRRPRQLRSVAVRLSAAAILYLAIRTAVVGGLAGDLPHPLWRGVGLVTRLETMVGMVPRGMALLLWPAHLQADYSPPELTLATGIAPMQVFGLVIVGVAVLVAVASHRARHPAIAAGVAWLILSLAPVSNLLLPTGLLLAERTLFLPSVGVVLALGGLLELGGRRGPWPAGLLTAATVTVAGVGIARSAERQSAWRDDTTIYGQTIVDAPLSYWAWRNWAGDLARRDRPVEAEAAYRRSLDLWDRDAQVLDDYGNFTRRSGRCAQAVPLFQKSLGIESTRHLTAARLIGCLVTLGDYASARSEADARIAMGRKEFSSLREMIDRAAESRR
jgi:hypothetical protein